MSVSKKNTKQIYVSLMANVRELTGMVYCTSEDGGWKIDYRLRKTVTKAPSPGEMPQPQGLTSAFESCRSLI